MKKASSSFVILSFAVALISLDAFAQVRPGRQSDREERREDRQEERREERREDRQENRHGDYRPLPTPIPQPIPHRPAPIPGSTYHPRPGHGPQIPRERQVVSNAILHVRVNQIVRGQARIDLMRLVRQQTGMTLEGADIKRVIVEGSNLNHRGHPATALVILNGQMEGRESYIDFRGRAPLPLRAYEEVRHSLEILVRGEAMIQTVQIRVGLVRPLRIR